MERVKTGRMTMRQLLKGVGRILLYGAAIWGAVDLIGAGIQRISLPKSPPNVVFLILDCWRYDYFTPELTPNIWELAQKGTSFTNFFVNSGYTCPSMASIFSGRLPQFVLGDMGEATGFRQLSRDPHNPRRNEDGAEMIPVNFTTFPELLKDFGYYTVAVVQNPSVGRWAGYDNKQWSVLNEFQIDDYSIGADTLVDVAVKCLENRPNKEKPFLLYIHFMDAHRPYNRLFLTEEEREKQEMYFATKETGDLELRERLLPEMKERYKRGVDLLDKQVARLIDRMADLNNTVFIVTADHGEMFNETGEAWNIEHGGRLPPEIVHVPLLISGGGIKGKIDSELREGIDIAPTVLSLAGIEPLAYMQGKNLLEPHGKNIVISRSPCETAYISKKGSDIKIVRTPLVGEIYDKDTIEELKAMGYVR